MKKHSFTKRGMRVCMFPLAMAAACAFTSCHANELPETEPFPSETFASDSMTELSHALETKEKTPIFYSDTASEEIAIPHGTVYEYSDALYEGEKKVKCQGTDGICVRTVINYYENGKLQNSETTETVKTEAVDEIVVLGTKNPISVTEKTEIENIMPHKTETRRDSAKYDDETVVVREGMDGYTRTVYRITLTKGVETSREKIASETYAPKNRIVTVGTKPAWHTETLTLQTDKIPFQTEYLYDKTLEKGKTYVKTEGKDGYTETSYQITYYHGKENTRKETGKTTVKPQNKIVVVGTKEETFVLPYLAWKHYPITQGYHSSHMALDIGVYYGDPIFAAMGGKVVYAYDEGDFPKSNPNWTYGTFVVIEHDNGMRTVYAHLKDRYVRAGQKVTGGQTIGTSGNTGRVTPRPSASNPLAGTHLHFEIRVWRNGRYVKVNPRNYLPI